MAEPGSRSPPGWSRTSPTMSPCAPATRPSTRPSTSKAGAGCARAGGLPADRTGAAQATTAEGQGPGQVRIPVRCSSPTGPPRPATGPCPAHWEGDLVIGKAGRSAMAPWSSGPPATRAGRAARRPPGRPHHPATPSSRPCPACPAELVKTLTWDQGSEMAGHAAFSLATAVDVYFAHPHSPWERGTNENTNGLLREYFPKGHAADPRPGARARRRSRRAPRRPGSRRGPPDRERRDPRGPHRCRRRRLGPHPELLGVGRQLAARDGVELAWEEGTPRTCPTPTARSTSCCPPSA